jgi:hypothetical protein
LIGLAPFVAGCIVIVIVGGQVFNLQLPTPFTLPRFWQELRTVYNVPDFWLWAYLVFAISNAMLPSAADRRAWGTTLVFVGIIGAVAYLTGMFSGAPSLRNASIAIGRWLWNAVDQLTYAFAIAVTVDLVVAAALFVTEQALALLGFGRLKYR